MYVGQKTMNCNIQTEKIMKKPEPKHTPKAIGERSQAHIIARLLEVGYDILIPYGDNQRYDLVIEDADRKLWRVQCKTGRLHGEKIVFNTVSLYHHTRAGRAGQGRRSYNGQIDFFAVYCSDNQEAYLIPIEHTLIGQMGLWLSMPKSKQEKELKWAKDYVI